MKHKHFKHLFTALLLLCTTVANAQWFEVDGICYSVIDDIAQLVEVYSGPTPGDNKKYTGHIVIPETVTYGKTYSVVGIGNSVFSHDEIISVVIPNSVKTIANFAFYGCEKLESVTIGNGVTIIEHDAFRACYALKSIEIPSSVTTIGGNAFLTCRALKNATIPNSVTTIEGSAFSGCSSLDKVIIPNSVTSVGDRVFFGCSSLTSIEIPGSLKNIEAQMFQECRRLKSVTIKDGVTNIGYSVFAYCDSLTEIEIPNSVTSIGDCAFDFCSALESVTIGNGVEIIGGWAFRNCISLTDLTIGNNVKTIGHSAFHSCTGLTGIELPNSVTEIKERAFSGCSNIKSITIPENVASIGEHTFSDCSGLTSITSLIPKEDLFAINSNAIRTIDKNSCILYVPYGAKETYASTAGWKEFINIVEMASYIHYKINGEVVFSELVAWGAEITPAAGIEKPGYRFIGWNGLPQYMPNNDIEVNGMYEDNVVYIVINQYGNATYCSPYALDFSNVEGLKAYAATGYNKVTQVVTLTRVQTTQEGTGLFLTGAPGEYKVPVIENSNDYTLNLLVGTLEPTTVNSTTGEMSNYKFTIADGDAAPMFYPFEDGTTLSAGKAYLQIPTSWLPTTSQKSLSIRFDDGKTTDIDEVFDDVKGENGKVKTIYDLQGRVVENPTSGIYIINGKKVVIK